MSIMHNALPYLGQVLLIAVLATVFPGSLLKDKRLRISAVSALLLLGLFFPVHGLTFSQWLRSVVGDLSLLSLVIFVNILAQRLFNLNLLKSSSRNSLMLWFTLAGVAFYPLALGVSSFDPYRLGYAPVLMPTILCIISIYSWLRDRRDLAVIILIPLIAFNLHLLESDNLWDYLMDPILFIYAVIHCWTGSISQRPRKWVRRVLCPESSNAQSNSAMWLSAIAIAVVLFQVGNLFYFVNRYSVDVPFWDQWDFYNAFFRPHGLWDIFSWQHGPHRQGAGFFLTWAVNELTGWNQRAQCFAIYGVILLAAITVLWLKKRLFGAIKWYDTIPVLFVLSLKQLEIYANTPNASHGAIPLLLILLLCVSLTFREDIARYASVVAINFMTIFTGFGVFAGLITPILIGIDCWHAFRSQKYSRLFFAVCAFFFALASMGLFLYNYQFAPVADGFYLPDPKWYLYPVFMAIEFGSLIVPGHLTSAQAIVGGVAIIGLLAMLVPVAGVLFRSEDNYHRSQVVLLLVSFTLLFSAHAAIWRLSLGFDDATVLRYVPLLIPAGIGAYLFLVGSPRWKEHGKFVLILFVATTLCTVPLWHRKEVEHYRKNKSAWVRAYMLTGDSTQADAMCGCKIYPNPVVTDLDGKLKWLRVHRYSLFRNPESGRLR